MAQIVTLTSDINLWSDADPEGETDDDYMERNMRLTALFEDGYELLTSFPATGSTGQIERIVDTLIKRL